MVWQALVATAASEGAKALNGSGVAAPPPAPDVLNQRNPINVAPVGVNLGAILQPYREGSTTNGGFELEGLSTPGTELGKVTAKPKDYTTPVLIGAGVLLLGAVVLRVSRRR